MSLRLSIARHDPQQSQHSFHYFLHSIRWGEPLFIGLLFEKLFQDGFNKRCIKENIRIKRNVLSMRHLQSLGVWLIVMEPTKPVLHRCDALHIRVPVSLWPMSALQQAIAFTIPFVQLVEENHCLSIYSSKSYSRTIYTLNKRCMESVQN